ncbi:LuxR C-terminal-related transcriptional regulator [Geodermatophilus sp. SYSU D00710]
MAEDSLIVREGLTRLLESSGHAVVVSVDRPDRLAAEVARAQPDVVVIDIRMPPTFTDEGLRAAAAIRHRHPGVGVLVLSQYVAPGYVTWLLEQTPDRVGYLLKDRLVDVGALAQALERIVAGETVVDPELVRLLIRSRARSGPLVSLTERERQVLALMAEGLSDRGIADRLVVSLHTVGTHVQHVFRKLAIPDTAADNRRVHAVVTWLQNGPPTPSAPPSGA